MDQFVKVSPQLRQKTNSELDPKKEWTNSIDCQGGHASNPQAECQNDLVFIIES